METILTVIFGVFTIWYAMKESKKSDRNFEVLMKDHEAFLEQVPSMHCKLGPAAKR